MAGRSSNQVIDQTARLVHFRAGSLIADPLGGRTSITVDGFLDEELSLLTAVRFAR